jgi:heme-degrading monooxygenase HmoA
MQIVLIDSFVVPDGSKEAFLQRVRQSGDILKTSPGLIEGYVYEKKSGDSDVNVVTTAVWQDEKALKMPRQSRRPITRSKEQVLWPL